MSGEQITHGESKAHSGRRRTWRCLGMVGAALLLAVIAFWVYHQYKPLPPGLDAVTPLRPAVKLRFLSDETWQTDGGDRGMQHAIFDEARHDRGAAQELVGGDRNTFR